MSSAVIERKIRQVYDLLDNKQFKKALKLVNSHIQKTPHPMLQAVKALVLQRSGEDEESLQILEELAAEKPNDLSLLDIMCLTYKCLGRSDRSAYLYSEMFNTQPRKEVGALLFNAYASAFNFPQQQAVALKLFKLFGDVYYGLIAVTSMCIQAYLDPAQKKLLDIATLFFQKVRTNPEFIMGPPMLKLELFMEELKGGGKSLQLLDEFSAFLDPGERLMRKAKILAESDKFAAIDCYHELLKLNLNEGTALMNWESYIKYINFVVELAGELSVEAADLEIERPAELFSSMRELSKEMIIKTCYANLKYTRKEINGTSSIVRNVKRTSRLAELQMIKVLLEKRILEENNKKQLLFPRLHKYIRKFNDIPSTIEDIKLFLEILPIDWYEELLNLILPLNHEAIENVNQLRSIATYWKLKYRLNLCTQQNLPELIRIYKTSLSIESDPKKGEHRIIDPLVIIISRILQQADTSLVSSIAILEFGLSKSPFNYFFKLELIDLYKKVGAAKSIVNTYNTLDIKSVQHESLGHLAFEEMNDWKFFSNEFSEECVSMLNFHRYSMIDIAESTQQAYRNHTIEQIVDFYSFRNRITNSLYFQLIKLTNLILKIQSSINDPWNTLKSGVGIFDAFLERGNLIDNSDTKVLSEYKILHSIEEKGQLFGRWSNFDYVEIEQMILKFAYKFQNNEGASADEELLKLKSKVESLAQSPILNEGYTFLYLLSEAVSNIKAGFDPLKESISKLMEFVNRFKSEGFLNFSSPEELKKTAFIIATVGFFSILLLKLGNLSLPNSPAKKKKGKSEPPANDLKLIFMEFVNEFVQMISDIKRNISEFLINEEAEKSQNETEIKNNLIDEIEGISVSSTFMKIKVEKAEIVRAIINEAEKVIITITNSFK
ncbi:unnamed protein product [Blepharisma stoltei]|uniref:N-terminal acetyltransferase B complex subunit NAA25 homolog n=1 Tax=Blepharisma stoltei TaxID=1481888 RepID=A0AAU9IMN8_9CILI|nr:unnamed protein product [Blepharisma stoltei]